MVKGCSLDGGGVKAIDEAVLIEYFEKKTGKEFSSLFDRFAGTSAGSEIACMCNHPRRHFSGTEIIEAFRELSGKVFRTSFWRRGLAGNLSSKYRVSVLADALSGLLSGIKLSESRKPLTIPTIDGDDGTEVFLKSDNEYSIWDMWAAATASSAAPYYFDGFQYNRKRYFDGGGAFNNPARILYRDLERHHGAAKDNTIILSLGCTFSEFTPYPNGGVQWLSRLFEFGNRPATNTTSTFLRDDIGDHFIRILVPHKQKISLDESNLRNIDKYIAETRSWIRMHQEELEEITKKITS